MHFFASSFAGSACLRPVFLLSLLLGFSGVSLAGEEGTGRDFQPGQFWSNFQTGYGNMHRRAGGLSESDSAPYFGLQLGVAVHPQVLVGVEYGEWGVFDLHLKTAPLVVSVSTRITQCLGVVHAYPVKGSSFHLNAGLGLVQGSESLSLVKDGDGASWHLGLGYDLRFHRRLAATPFLRYSGGKINDLSFSVWTVGLGIAWR